MDMNSSYSTKTLQDYEVLSVIGNGAFGTCYKVRDKVTGYIYAWKGMDYDELSEQQKESLISEIQVLRQLQHVNIVQYYHHLINHEAKSIFIVMECCEGGDLAQLIAKAKNEQKRFEERYIWRILFQICRALQVCHNKIKEGTILHRDIKPANIFLDKCGNAKLGDFGLARVLRRNENFAESFVGTPYYMSPEVIMGMKYDRKSDVWAVGCLTYEMCSLRPPFRGSKLPQLSTNITLGKFDDIPLYYSNDLQLIISFMLVVESERRPSIEMISRHPVVIRNINDLGNEFPVLIANYDIDQQKENNANTNKKDISDYCQLKKSDVKQRVSRKLELEYIQLDNFTSTMKSEEDQTCFSANIEDRKSITGIFTPDLRAELFYSFRHKLPSLQKSYLSDPELYDSIAKEKKMTCAPYIRDCAATSEKCPATVTEEIFEKALRTRLQSIRAHESLLRQKEEDLLKWEQLLNEREKRLTLLEENLIKKSEKIAAVSKPSSPQPPTIKPPNRPPIPPRKSTPKHDDTYCSIESNDIVMQHEPTIKKLNINKFSAARKFATHVNPKKVTFQTPKKFLRVTCDDADLTINPTRNSSNKNIQMEISTSSGKTSERSTSTENSSNSHQRRKTFFALLGLSRNNKNKSQESVTASKTGTSTKALIQNASGNSKAKSVIMNDENLVIKCQPPDFENIWTKENKRAAFEMLAAMNSAANGGEISDKRHRESRNKMRQSLRERNSLHRSHNRRSLATINNQPRSSFNQRNHHIML